MEPRERTGCGWAAAVCVVLVILLPAVYVLSLGPAVRYYDGCSPAMQNAIETVYAPLVWLHENTILEEPLRWYVELWDR